LNECRRQRSGQGPWTTGGRPKEMRPRLNIRSRRSNTWYVPRVTSKRTSRQSPCSTHFPQRPKGCSLSRCDRRRRVYAERSRPPARLSDEIRVRRLPPFFRTNPSSWPREFPLSPYPCAKSRTNGEFFVDSANLLGYLLGYKVPAARNSPRQASHSKVVSQALEFFSSWDTELLLRTHFMLKGSLLGSERVRRALN
jgi:hypothetical protein